MWRYVKRSSLLLTMITPLGAAAEDGVYFNLSAQTLEDSNISRTSTAHADSVSSLAGTISANKTFEKHSVNLRWAVEDVKYKTRSDLDAVIQEGELGLQSNWTHRLISNVQWSRNAYAVDQLEFPERDLVTQDLAKAKIGYGTENRFVTYLGMQQIDQNHSNLKRESLNYQEQEGFVETDYYTASRSNISLFFKAGSRHYSEAALPTLVVPSSPQSSLDFNYERLELDGQWILSPKTKLKLLIASFKRDGKLNNGAGALYSIGTFWNPSEKISVKLSYQENQPAIGELSDTPAVEKNTSSSVDWQFSQKLKLGTYVAYSQRNYTLETSRLARNEKMYVYAPLSIQYALFKNISVRIEGTIRRNESPIVYREYRSRQLLLNLTAHF